MCKDEADDDGGGDEDVGSDSGGDDIDDNDHVDVCQYNACMFICFIHFDHTYYCHQDDVIHCVLFLPMS